MTVSRYLDWARSEDDHTLTAFGNWLFTKLYNFFFHQSVTDYLVMFRAFRTTFVNELQVKLGAISWQSQLMCRAAKASKKLGEIPGDEPAPIGGTRTMSPIRNGLAELTMLATEYFR